MFIRLNYFCISSFIHYYVIFIGVFLYGRKKDIVLNGNGKREHTIDLLRGYGIIISINITIKI